MDNKIIFVNATSMTLGGALTILNEYINNLKNLNDKSKTYYIFVPIDCEIKSTENLIMVPKKAKSYRDRIIWDLWGMKKWSVENEIYPDIILSLQNTGVRFNKVKKIIYLHQSLPYSKESKWNLLKKDEIKMWFYRYIYKIWIRISIKKQDHIVVQTEWMKEALVESKYSKDNIIVSKPSIQKIDIDKVNLIDKDYDKVYFFYPASDYKYKNHNIIIEALKKIKNEDLELLRRIKVIFTLSKDSNIYKKVIDNNLEKYIDFVGNLEYKDVLRYYKSCDVVLFPSYIETFGLPLVEASLFGKKILTSDCNYSREVMQNYKNVEFINYKDSVAWSNLIKDSLNCNNEIYRVEGIFDGGWDELNNLINCI